MTIKLPKPFKTIVHKEYSQEEYNKGYTILEAYVDERHYKLNNGLLGIREKLGLSEDDVVCDLFCKIQPKKGKQVSLIFEDKKTKHQGKISHAIKQLVKSNTHIKSKLNQIIDFAILCRMSMERPFTAKKEFGSPFKVVYIKFNNKQTKAFCCNISIRAVQFNIIDHGRQQTFPNFNRILRI